MKIDASFKCDLCGCAITMPSFVVLAYPFNAEQKRQLEHACLVTVPASLLGLQAFTPVIHTHLNLELCQPCIDGILPQVADVVARRVVNEITMRRSGVRAETGE